MSAAVEAAADEPFLTFMRKQIFEPLGMHDTRADSATEPIPDRATSYFPRFAADPRYGLHLMRPLDYSCYAGSSAFLSTPSDLVRFGMAINSGKLLQPATVQLLQTSQRLASGQETGYGLGWDLETVALAGKQTRVVGHDGESLGGMVASLMTFPEHGIVVSVTSNISYADTYCSCGENRAGLRGTGGEVQHASDRVIGLSASRGCHRLARRHARLREQSSSVDATGIPTRGPPPHLFAGSIVEVVAALFPRFATGGPPAHLLICPPFEAPDSGGPEKRGTKMTHVIQPDNARSCRRCRGA